MSATKRFVTVLTTIGLGLGGLLTTAVAVAPPAGAAAQIEVGDTGFTSTNPAIRAVTRWNTTIATVVTNPTKLVWGVTGTWTMKDASGKVLRTASGSYPYVLPGQTVYLGTWQTTDVQVASVDFQLGRTVSASQTRFEKSFAPPAIRSKKLGVPTAKLLKVADARYHDWGAERGGSNILGTFTSSAKVPVNDILIGCALFKGDKVVGGGSSVYQASVAPGKPAGFSAGLSGVFGIAADSVRCSAALTSGSEAVVGDAAKLTVVDASLEQYPDTITTYYAIRAAVQNGSKSIADSVHVEYDLLDSAGRVVGHHGDLLGYVLPGDIAYSGEDDLAAYWMDGTPNSVRVTVAGDPVTATEFQERYDVPADPSKFTFTNLGFDPSSRTPKITGTIAAPGITVAVQAKVLCGSFTSGKLGGFGFDYVQIPAGGSGSIEAFTTPGASGGEVRCYGNVGGVTTTTPTS